MCVVSRLGTVSTQRMNCRAVAWEPDVLALHTRGLAEASGMLATVLLSGLLAVKGSYKASMMLGQWGFLPSCVQVCLQELQQGKTVGQGVLGPSGLVAVMGVTVSGTEEDS